MKRFVPFFVAIILIFIIAGSYGFSIVQERFSYSQEKYDLNEYFHLENDTQVAVMVQDELTEMKGLLIDGVCYFDMDTVLRIFNDRFYEDKADQQILYALPEELVIIDIGTGNVSIDGIVQSQDYVIAQYVGNTLYMAVDFLKDYANFNYRLYKTPNHIQLETGSVDRTVATIKKDTQVRYRGGVKSEILVDVKKGEQVIILEEMEEWSKVKTSESYIGYVENKRLENQMSVEGIPATNYVAPEYTSVCRDYKINMAWHDVAGLAGNDTLYDLLANTSGINVISPTWFYLDDNEGNIVSFASESYVQYCHDKGMEVWALIDNFSNPDVSTYEALIKRSGRANLISQLMNQVDTYHLDGINVDFEDVSSDAGPAYVEFLRELSIECRKRGTVLSVDNYVPMGFNDHYNRKEQGVVADYVVIMGYDEHYKGSEEAGSVASISYVDYGISKTLEDVPANKIINGIPFYTRIWETNGTAVDSQAVSMDIAQQWLKDHNITTKWDEETCQNYGEYTKGDSVYQCWLEDSDSVEVKLNVMDNYHIGGVAEWKLGFEQANVWNTISDYINK